MKMLVNQYGHAEVFGDDTIVAHGIDPNGVCRCFGAGITSAEADDQCKAAIMEYVRGRPDTGPIEKWKIEYELGSK